MVERLSKIQKVIKSQLITPKRIIYWNRGLCPSKKGRRGCKYVSKKIEGKRYLLILDVYYKRSSKKGM